MNIDPSVILFDIGGVLVELDGMPSMYNMLKDQRSIEDISRMWEECEAVNLYETGKIKRQEFAERAVVQLGLPISADRFLKEFAKWPRRLHDNALALINLAAEKFQIAALSNISELQWKHVGSTLGLDVIFKYKFLSFEIGFMKPDPKAYHAAIEGLKVEPEEILFIDDNPQNVSQAISLGMQSVCVKNSDEAMAFLSDVVKAIA